jgi:UDP-N-acetylbacillosamine N-acetyltransferase
MKRLVILGSGGYGRTVYDVAEQLSYSITFLDDSDKGHPLDSFSHYLNGDTEFIPAFGNNEFRLGWLERIEKAGGKPATLIHPSAYVSPRAYVSEGCVILPGAIINTGTRIGKGCIINLGATVDHDVIVEDGVHLCVRCIIKGENRILRCEKIEAGEIIERATRK